MSMLNESVLTCGGQSISAEELLIVIQSTVNFCFARILLISIKIDYWISS